MTLPPWLLGTWQLESVRIADVTSSTLDVHYVQTPRGFGDVRIPRGRPCVTARSLGELSDSELAALAQQRGFFGITSIVRDIATWQRELDYQPSDGGVDRGRIERVGTSGMREHGLDPERSFLEHWWSLGSGDGRFLAMREIRDGRLERALAVAGDHFVYARNRATDLPVAESLAALVARASRTEILAYLDCEISHGRVRGGRVAWEIERSTLPWREGTRLALVDELTVLDGTLRARVAGETWTAEPCTFSVDDLRVMLA